MKVIGQIFLFLVAILIIGWLAPYISFAFSAILTTVLIIGFVIVAIRVIGSVVEGMQASKTHPFWIGCVTLGLCVLGIYLLSLVNYEKVYHFQGREAYEDDYSVVGRP